MFGRPETLAEWKEPHRLTRHRADQALKRWSWKSRAGFVLSPVLIFIALFYVLSRIWGQSFSSYVPSIVEIFGASILFVLALPWYTRHCPWRVRVHRKGVAVMSGRTRTVPFGEIRRATFSTRVVDGYRIRTLILDTVREHHYELGIDSSITPAEIAQVLAREGVRVDPDVD